MEYHLRVILLWCFAFAVMILGASGLFCSAFSDILEPAACGQFLGTVRSMAGRLGR